MFESNVLVMLKWATRISRQTGDRHFCIIMNFVIPNARVGGKIMVKT
jgi:hypothetical protein